MSNMSYCRFENTLADLRDCYENLDDNLGENIYEARARVKLVALCQKIVDNADIEWFQDELDEAKQLSG